MQAFAICLDTFRKTLETSLMLPDTSLIDPLSSQSGHFEHERLPKYLHRFCQFCNDDNQYLFPLASC